MKKKLVVLAATAIGITVMTAAPASAAQVCYDITIGLPGQAPIVQAGCQELPGLP